jgi:hypothetical protein
MKIESPNSLPELLREGVSKAFIQKQLCFIFACISHPVAMKTRFLRASNRSLEAWAIFLFDKSARSC